MSELQDAFDKYDKTGSAYGNVGLFVEAARKYANPDYEAATVYAVKLFMGDKAAQEPIPPHIRTGSERIVKIALGVTEDEGERHDGECDCVQCELARAGLDFTEDDQ